MIPRFEPEQKAWIPDNGMINEVKIICIEWDKEEILYKTMHINQLGYEEIVDKVDTKEGYSDLFDDRIECEKYINNLL